MEQFKRLLASLSIPQRITLLAVAVAVFGGLFAFARWRRESDFKPLYTAMAPEDAGAVVQKLKEGGVDYRLSENGGAVLVASAKVADIRLEMAAAGLPKTGRIGFELFDKTNFGATDFTEHINYRRAIEGELERSVMSLSEVEQARVHVTFPKESVYLESRQPAKASVMLRLRPGARISPQNVVAICHLLASAVEGLTPEAVSVLDMRGNLLSRPKKAAAMDGTDPPDANLDYRQSVERDLLAKINTTLEPLLGADKFRAGVSVECDFAGGEQSEETFDPTRSVMVTSQKTEDVSGAGGASGVPGTASNLPRPTSRPGVSQAGMTRRTENISYQSSRIVRRTRLPQGNLKRMSVSVLLDQGIKWEGQSARAQRVLVPPSPERVKTIRDLVAGITGFTQERGDQLVVESLPFESTLNAEPPAPPSAGPPTGPGVAPSWLESVKRNPKQMILPGAGALTLIVLLVVFKMARKKRKVAQASAPAALAGRKHAPAENPALDAAQQRQQIEAQFAEQAALQEQMDADALTALKLTPAATNKAEVLTKHIRESLKKDPALSSQILRSWLGEEAR